MLMFEKKKKSNILKILQEYHWIMIKESSCIGVGENKNIKEERNQEENKKLRHCMQH